jgi:hypothetical protein
VGAGGSLARALLECRVVARPAPVSGTTAAAGGAARERRAAMDERGFLPIVPGAEVYDRAGHKLGTVTHLHEPAAPGAAGTSTAGGYVEVATGLLSRLGLAKPLFVPLEAVRDVTEGGVFLVADRAEIDRADWHTRPAAPARSDAAP